RRDVARRMEGYKNEKTDAKETRAGADIGSNEPGREDRQKDPSRRRDNSGIRERHPLRGRPAESDRRAERPAGIGIAQPETLAPDSRDPGSKSGSTRLRDARALRTLRRLDVSELKSLSDEVRALSKPPLDRARDTLQKRKEHALAQYHSPAKFVSATPVLVSMRMRLDEAIQRKRDFFYSSAHVVQMAEDKLAEPEPTGIWNRLLGRHREWMKQREQAERLLASVEDSRARMSEEIEVLQT